MFYILAAFIYLCFTIIALTFIYAVIFFIKMLFIYLIGYAESKILNSKYNRELRNNILSNLYFIKDLGAGVSSVAIVAVILSDYESILQLFLLTYVGWKIRESARQLIKFYFKIVEKTELDPLGNLKEEIYKIK